MADVFQSAPMSYGGGFRSDLGMLETTDGITGILMQNIQVTYQRPITKIYELGNAAPAPPGGVGPPAEIGTNVYYVEGRPQGSLTLARILGFAASINAFYVKYGSACRAGGNTMTLALNSIQCTGGVQVKLAMSYCVLTSVGVSVNAQQLVINENCGMEFANMVYTGP
jgi:hypothetical protein